MNAEERFGRLVEEFARLPDVEAPTASGGRRFGSDALKVNGSIFAMVTGGHLVLKLPRDRVRALIESGAGATFAAGKKRPMQEWLTVVDDDEETCLALAHEALSFVRAKPRT
ncbi:MAG: TfoX/Sxy family protein [Actinomycetota bacterium]|nr:TfoX/Sxy family protein [Actinomycetota bacterium]